MSTSHPVTSPLTYVAVFLSLAVLTILTVVVAYYDFGFMNVVVALGIAVIKASLVVWFFMGVRYNTPLTRVVVVAGLFWLLIMFGLGMSDYLTRGWLGVPGR
ncbi:MAG: cytochrome C oxidase subunit IV family protein [Vicinamibacterales bacterium]